MTPLSHTLPYPLVYDCLEHDPRYWLARIVSCGLVRATLFVSLFTEPGLCMSTWFSSAHAQNKQLVDREVIFAQFDKWKVYWIRIDDQAFTIFTLSYNSFQPIWLLTSTSMSFIQISVAQKPNL